MRRNVPFCWLLLEKCVVCVNVRKARSKEQEQGTRGWNNSFRTLSSVHAIVVSFANCFKRSAVVYPQHMCCKSLPDHRCFLGRNVEEKLWVWGPLVP